MRRNLGGLKERRAALGQRPAREWRELTLLPAGMSLEEHSRLQMRTRPAAILILAGETQAGKPAASAQMSDLQNSELTNGCCVKPKFVFICYAARER